MTQDCRGGTDHWRGAVQALGRGNCFPGVVRRVSARVRLPGFESWLCCFELWKLVQVECAQLCPALCDPVDCSPPGFYPWDSPGKNTGVSCHFLLQGIFPTQGSNRSLLCFLHCRQMVYHWAIREACASGRQGWKPCLPGLAWYGGLCRALAVGGCLHQEPGRQSWGDITPTLSARGPVRASERELSGQRELLMDWNRQITDKTLFSLKEVLKGAAFSSSFFC